MTMKSVQIIHIYELSQTDAIRHLNEVLKSLGFAYSSSIQLQRGIQDQVINKAKQPAYIVGPRLGNWTPIIDIFADPWTGDISRLISEASGTYSLAILVYDDDVMLYNLDRAGVAVDGYNSVPVYFEEGKVTESHIESQRHEPEHFQQLIPKERRVQGLLDILDQGWWSAYDAGRLDADGMMIDEDLGEYKSECERMTDFGTYLELAGPDQPYLFAYWDDKDEIDWDRYLLVEYSRST